MSMVANRSIHILVDAEDINKLERREGAIQLEPLDLEVAQVLKEVVERQTSNLVNLKKQSIDEDNRQTNQMLARLLE